MDLETEPIKTEDESEENRVAVVARKSKTALVFDAAEILARNIQVPLKGSSYVASQIENKIQSDEIRKSARKEEITDKELTEALSKLTSPHSHEAQKWLSVVSNQLSGWGLWMDEDRQQIIMSQAFPLSHAKADTRLSADLPELVDHAAELGDSDFTHDDRSSHFNKKEHASYASGLKVLQHSKPVTNNLMRPRPRDLYHQTARKMIEGTFFEVHHEYAKLFKCCYFASKGVEDETHFNVLLEAGLQEKFSHYTFEQFRVERILLRKIIRGLIDNHFSENPLIVRLLSQHYGAGEKSDPRKIWERFNRVWDSLTVKQQETLEAAACDGDDKFSVKDAVEKLGIAENAVKNRLFTAKRRFRKEFPEFKSLTPRTFVGDLRSTYTHNGLWHYPSREKVHPLKKIDPLTGKVLEILPPPVAKYKNLDPATKAQIKAMAIENCPIPYIDGADYFDGMKPTILSFGREPGNLDDKESD